MDSMSERLASLKHMSHDEIQSKINETKEKERLEKERAAATEAARQKAIMDGLAKAKVAFAAGRYAEAERDFDAVLMENPDNRVDIVCNRAACALKQGNYSDALADASEVTSMDPSNVKAHYRMALAQKGLGTLERALNAAREGLKLQPDSAMLLKLILELEESMAAKQLAQASTMPSAPTPQPPPPPPLTSLGAVDPQRQARSLADLAEGRERNRMEHDGGGAVLPGLPSAAGGAESLGVLV